MSPGTEYFGVTIGGVVLRRGPPMTEAELEERWRREQGVDPVTGEGWLTPRMLREAEACRRAWGQDQPKEQRP